MREGETSGPRGDKERRLPPLRYPALGAWLQAHPLLLDQLFPERRFQSGEPIPGTGEGRPRALIVVSGEVLLTQVLPGSVEPCKVLYAGDIWVDPSSSNAGPGAPLMPIQLVAEAPCQIRVLSQEGLAAQPELVRLLEAYGEFLRQKHTLFEELRRTEQFRNVRAQHLLGLVDLAEVRLYKQGDFVCRQGQVEGKGVFLVLRGELAETDGAETGGPQAPSLHAHVIPAGQLVGAQVMHSHDEVAHPHSVVVRSPEALVAFVSQEASDLLSHRAPLFQRLREPSPFASPEVSPVAEGEGSQPEVVLFRGGPREEGEWGEAALRGLVDGVAEGIRAEYRDAVLVVDVEPGPEEPAPRCPPPVDAQGLPVTHHRVKASNGAAATEVLKALARSGQPWDYLFVRVAPSLWEGLALPDGHAHGFLPQVQEAPVWKVVVLVSHTEEMVVPPGFGPESTLFTVLLGRAPRREERGDRAGTVRLRLKPGPFARGVRFAELSPPERDTLLRWGRAITERLVGVALGGGGSWGFAEMVFLQEMARRKIPVDLVSGTSFGALTAAFFCEQGIAGLQRLREELPRLTWVIRASILSSLAIETFVNRLNGGVRLEELEIPCFPVATNISNAQVHISRCGSLGWGVRASGALSGVFSPAFWEGYRMVDGGFIANVPASILKTWRASLIVAVNVVPQPPVRPPSKPLLPTRLGWFLHGLNPIERLIDAIHSMMLVFHTSGQQSAQAADVVFTCPFVPFSPGDYSHSQQIMDAAREAAQPALAQLQRKWDEMRLPRRERLALSPQSPQEAPDAGSDVAAG